MFKSRLTVYLTMAPDEKLISWPDFSAYQAVVLGRPFYCEKFSSQKSLEQYRQLADILYSQGIKFYLGGPYFPDDQLCEDFLELIARILGHNIPVAGIYCQDPGLARAIIQRFKSRPDLEIRGDFLMSFYSTNSAELLRSIGYKTLIPPPELTENDFHELGERFRYEIPIFGKIPLACSRACLVTVINGNCNHCLENLVLNQGPADITLSGRLTLSGGCLNRVNDLGKLSRLGYRNYMVSALDGNYEMVSLAGKVFREALAVARVKIDNYDVKPAWKMTLRRFIDNYEFSDFPGHRSPKPQPSKEKSNVPG